MKTNKASFIKLSISIAVLASVGIMGVQYVAAQTATSSDAIASSTPPDTSVASTSAATTTSDTVATTTDANSSASTSTTATVPAQSPSQATSTVTTAPAAPSVNLQAIAALEDTYKRANGRYLQILPGNRLPGYESGSVASDLGQTIPDGVEVDIYQAPGGDGYQISYQENGTAYSFGAGPEASSRTYTIQLPVVVVTATSTPTQ